VVRTDTIGFVRDPLNRQALNRPAPDPAHATLKAPNALLLMLEGRAFWEYAALLASAPWLTRVPTGDGHPVIVFPGLIAGDLTTLPLRMYLRTIGYAPYRWEQGFNLGPRDGVIEACRDMVRDIARRHGRKVSLVGWSLGGVYARELAKELAPIVRTVITLGTPFAGNPRATNAWRVFELASGQPAPGPDVLAQIRRAPPVPTTSIFSRSDGIVNWRCCLNEPGPQTENIELQASHVGMGLNPLSLYAIADRLAQPEGEWQPFDPSGVRRWFFSTGENGEG
jgi:pimeloyl-ACP methyl ester carboxylesterase